MRWSPAGRANDVALPLPASRERFMLVIRLVVSIDSPETKSTERISDMRGSRRFTLLLP